MKKIIILITLCLGINYVQAQKVQFGIKGGLNISNLGGNAYAFDSRTGFHIGGLAHIHINKNWALQPELLYSLQGAEYYAGSKYKYNLGYISVPILVQYMFASGFRLETGPQIAPMIHAHRVGNNQDVDMEDNFRTVDFSWAFGLGYLFPSGFGVDARYNAGITDIWEPDMTTLHNNVFQIGAFYQFK